MRTAILDLVYVGLGGFIGSIGRYLASGAVHQIFPNVYFPIGTAVVNIIGCFLIGIHTAKILRLSSDLPIVIEIVDTSEKIEQFMPIIDDAIKEGLATLEKATIRFYRGGK